MGGCLPLLAALLCAGCVVANPSPDPPTAALITATTPPTARAVVVAPPSPTAITIVTPTPGDTAPASATLPPSPTPPGTSPAPSATQPPEIPTSTPIASETPTSAPARDTLAPTQPPPTAPPQATAAPVGIISFSISPQTIKPGDRITLTWQATGQQAAIYRQEAGGPLTDMHNVPLSGTLTLLTDTLWRNSVAYVLYAGAGGSTASATVSAVILCPDKWYFANPPAGCPRGSSTLVPMAGERFEHGLMIWLSGQDQIYILFGDGASRPWSVVQNKWFQGQPASDPSLVPPAGLFQPVRGFGVAWRSDDASSGQTVRARLGWATEAESALTGGFQCDSASKYNQCYISGPGGQVYHLKPEFSGWEVWQGP